MEVVERHRLHRTLWGEGHEVRRDSQGHDRVGLEVLVVELVAEQLSTELEPAARSREPEEALLEHALEVVEQLQLPAPGSAELDRSERGDVQQVPEHLPAEAGGVDPGLALAD